MRTQDASGIRSDSPWDMSISLEIPDELAALLTARGEDPARAALIA